MTEKGFVWWSTPESRAVRRISVLAIAETVLAVALYWWIAISFDTHLHLVTSLFVAPLLLLRSERSIAAGADWFLRDWFGLKNYEKWSRARKAFWLGISALPGFAVSWWASSHLAHAWLPDQTGLALSLSAILIGMIGTLLGLMIGMAGAGYAVRAISGWRRPCGFSFPTVSNLYPKIGWRTTSLSTPRPPPSSCRASGNTMKHSR